MHILEKQKVHIAQDVLSKIQNVMWKILKSVIQQVNKIGNRALSEPFGPARQKGNGVWIAQISAMHRSPCRWNEGACALTIWQRLRKFPALDFPTVRNSIQFTSFHCIGVGVVIFTKNYFASSFFFFFFFFEIIFCSIMLGDFAVKRDKILSGNPGDTDP